MRSGLCCLLSTLIFILGSAAVCSAHPLDIAYELAGVRSGALAWGDYDSDGDLDLAVAGSAQSGRITRIYQNNGGAFTAARDFTGVSSAALAWGDFNGDGDLDLAFTGETPSGRITRVYRNDRRNFTLIAALPGISKGALGWADLDGDGHIELVAAGESAAGPVTRVYRYNSGTFSEMDSNLPGYQRCSLALGDCDNDGDIDMVISGQLADGTASTRLYLNNNGTLSPAPVTLPGVLDSSVTWTDINSDGLLDLALCGTWQEPSTGTLVPISRIFLGGPFTEVNAGLAGVSGGKVACGDLDGDGDMDLVITGSTAGSPLARTYRNLGGSFDLWEDLEGLSSSSLSLGDFDRDGDLDLAAMGDAGTELRCRIYKNSCEVSNTAPIAPTGLSALRNGTSVTFSWNGAVDDTTPSGAVTYNLRVGTAPGDDDILSSVADVSGFRKLSEFGNTGHRLSKTIPNLPDAAYHWSVQSVDSAYVGSAWAMERCFGSTRIIRVKPDGNDSASGEDWASAKGTVQSAIDASSAGGEVWVEAGVYPQRIVLKDRIRVYGGFAGNEESLSERNWKDNPAILDGGAGGSVVASPSGITPRTLLDGFVIRNGSSECGGGVYCYFSSPTIRNNTIRGNSAGYGAGVYCSSSSPHLVNNIICRNTANRSGGGVYCSSSWAVMTNNTIAGNMAAYGAGAWLGFSSPLMQNNIIAFNDFECVSNNGGFPVLVKNVIYNPTSYGAAYSGLYPGEGDILKDPVFVSVSNGDYHLAMGSPCVDSGTNTVSGVQPADIDCEPRIQARAIDIGADERTTRIDATSLLGAKQSADGCVADINGFLVSAVFGDLFYIEADDRSSGLRVELTGHTFRPGDRVWVLGSILTNPGGERYLAAVRAGQTGSGSLGPLAVINKSLGGADFYFDEFSGEGQKGIWGASGLNNTGLLVRTCGRITSIDGGVMYIDDGGRLRDGTTRGLNENVGVRVVVDPSGYSVGDHIVVTGISSCFRNPSGHVMRQVLATSVQRNSVHP